MGSGGGHPHPSEQTHWSRANPTPLWSHAQYPHPGSAVVLVVVVLVVVVLVVVVVATGGRHGVSTYSSHASLGVPVGV